MIRFAARASLLTFSGIVLLVLFHGETSIVNGAFQSEQYLVFVGPADYPFSDQVMAMSDSGEIIPLSDPLNDIYLLTTHGNRVAWVDSDQNLTLWEAGKRYHAGRINSALRWSADDQLAWLSLNNNEGTLHVWDGEEIQEFVYASFVYPPYQFEDWGWTGNELWWVQNNKRNRWQLLRWDGESQSIVYTNNQNFTWAEFLPCGTAALFIGQRSLHIFDQNREESILQLPVNNSLVVQSSDCQSFILSLRRGSQWSTSLWDGEVETPLPFAGQILSQAVRNGDQVLGSEILLDQVQLSSMKGDVILQHVLDIEDPYTVSLLNWHNEFSFWEVIASDTYLVFWNAQANEIKTFRLFAFAESSNLDIQNHRQAWISPSLMDKVLRLTVWQLGEIEYYDFPRDESSPIVHHANMRWMNDGSLIIALLENRYSGPQTEIYRWHNQEFELIMTVEGHIGQLSDWITLE